MLIFPPFFIRAKKHTLIYMYNRYYLSHTNETNTRPTGDRTTITWLRMAEHWSVWSRSRGVTEVLYWYFFRHWIFQGYFEIPPRPRQNICCALICYIVCLKRMTVLYTIAYLVLDYDIFYLFSSTFWSIESLSRKVLWHASLLWQAVGCVRQR